MDETKLRELLRKVIAASEKKKIDWQKNSKTDSAYKAVLGTNTLHVILAYGSYKFIIVNDQGDEIGNLSGILNESEIRKLFELAKKIALKIDENIDDINSMLDSFL